MNKRIITQLNKRRQSLQSLLKFADEKLKSIVDEKNILQEEYDVIAKLLVFYEQQKPGNQSWLDFKDETDEHKDETDQQTIIKEDLT